MANTRRQPNLRLVFSVMEGCFWIMVFLTEGLFSSYLIDFGYGEAFIGLSFMSTGIAAILLNPLCGFLLDKFRNCRWMLLGLTGVTVGLTPLFFALSSQKTVILLYSTVAMSFVKGCMGVIDSWISKLSRERPGAFDYGKIRSIGSISYAIAAVVFGQVLSALGNDFAQYLMLGVWLVLAMCAFLAPNPISFAEDKEVRLRSAAKELFHNRAYLLFLGCGLLTSFTSQSSFTFYPLLIREVGGDVGDIGLGYFILAFCEFFVVMYFSKIARKLGTARALGIGMVGYGIKNLVLALSPSLPFALAASCLQAISFAFVIPGAVMFINETISRTYVASALVVYQAVQNLTQITASPITGAVSQQYSVKVMTALFSIPAFVGGGIFLLVNALGRRRKAAGDPSAASCETAHEPVPPKEDAPVC